MNPNIGRDSIPEGEPWPLTARVPGLDGAALQRADVTSWSLKVFLRHSNDLSNLTTELFELTGTGTSTNFNSQNVWEDTLQTDGLWGGLDKEGYNFRRIITDTELLAPTSPLPEIEGGNHYWVELRVVTTNDGIRKARWLVEVENWYGE